jgi:hypothetical protein
VIVTPLQRYLILKDPLIFSHPFYATDPFHAITFTFLSFAPAQRMHSIYRTAPPWLKISYEEDQVDKINVFSNCCIFYQKDIDGVLYISISFLANSYKASTLLLDQMY